MTRVGSVQWAAPEVLLGLEYDASCDQWGFGVLIWELLTGRLPFAGMDKVSVARAVGLKGVRLPTPDRGPRELKQLVLSCWKDRHDRPSFYRIAANLRDLRARSA
mmetsp:Transcript_5138/g.13514  ORF Transcript_5138/g.13514 Transcript_5138/m.13514 type:complete len:105 (+) Transcript_5138:774-1088(+)